MAAIWVFAEYSNGAMDKVTYEVVSRSAPFGRCSGYARCSSGVRERR